MRTFMLASLGLFLLSACSAGVQGTTHGGTQQGEGAGSCSEGSALTGATYDVHASKFAFGSTPVESQSGGLDRWTGTDGVVGVNALGGVIGSLNGSAPESNLPDWSTDEAALTNHVTSYFAAMGVESCQIASSGIDGSASGGGTSDGTTTTSATHDTVVLNRGIEGIPIADSTASARFDNADQSVLEYLFWPTIPAAAVTAATSFKSALATPGALAAFKAKLPSDAQGDGAVVIHHTPGLSTSTTIQAVATYDVQQANSFGDGASLSFDANGNAVTLPQ